MCVKVGLLRFAVWSLLLCVVAGCLLWLFVSWYRLFVGVCRAALMMCVFRCLLVGVVRCPLCVVCCVLFGVVCCLLSVVYCWLFVGCCSLYVVMVGCCVPRATCLSVCCCLLLVG